MPYRKGARFTITNEGSRRVGAFYSNIDFVAVDTLPDDALYFHASLSPGRPLHGHQERWQEPRRQIQLRLLRDAPAAAICWA